MLLGPSWLGFADYLPVTSNKTQVKVEMQMPPSLVTPSPQALFLSFLCGHHGAYPVYFTEPRAASSKRWQVQSLRWRRLMALGSQSWTEAATAL